MKGFPKNKTGFGLVFLGDAHNRAVFWARYTGMLYTIAIILLVLWLVGWLGFHILGAFIHILVILAVIFFVIALVRKV